MNTVFGSWRHCTALDETSDKEAPESSKAQATRRLPLGPSKMTWLVIIKLCGTDGGELVAATLAVTWSTAG